MLLLCFLFVILLSYLCQQFDIMQIVVQCCHILYYLYQVYVTLLFFILLIIFNDNDVIFTLSYLL